MAPRSHEILKFVCRPVARSGLGGGAFQANVAFFLCFLRESGLFCALFGKNWTFSCAFLGKVDLFCVLTACPGHVSGENFEKYN